MSAPDGDGEPNFLLTFEVVQNVFCKSICQYISMSGQLMSPFMFTFIFSATILSHSLCLMKPEVEKDGRAGSAASVNKKSKLG